MPFTSSLTMNGPVAHITLTGELDRSSARDFQNSIEEAAAASPTRLVLHMQDLEYMASAGLRVLVFAKQKMSSAVDIYMVGTREEVAETIKATGVDQGVIMVETYEG